MNKEFEETRGYYAALQAIRMDGNTVSAAKHHRDVSCCDLTPNPFTKGWQFGCDEFIDINTIPE